MPEPSRMERWVDEERGSRSHTTDVGAGASQRRTQDETCSTGAGGVTPTGPSYPQGLREVKGPPLLGGPHRVLWASTRTQWNLAAGLEVEDGGRWAPATRA